MHCINCGEKIIKIAGGNKFTACRCGAHTGPKIQCMEDLGYFLDMQSGVYRKSKNFFSLQREEIDKNNKELDDFFNSL